MLVPNLTQIQILCIIRVRVGCTNRILMPVLGRANRCLQDSAPYFFWNVRIQIEVTERLLDPAEGLFGNRHVLGILESVQICLLQHRPKRNRCRGPQLCWFVIAVQNGEQSVGKLVVDDGEVSCQLCSEKAVGFVDRSATKPASATITEKPGRTRSPFPTTASPAIWGIPQRSSWATVRH